MRRYPWKPFLLPAIAFLLLGAAGESDVSLIIAAGGFVLSVGGAAMGYGMTKQKVDQVKESADKAHQRITDVKEDIGEKIERLTGAFHELRLELAEAGHLRAARRKAGDHE